jgi:sugar phosphate isomerase/epimerase
VLLRVNGLELPLACSSWSFAALPLPTALKIVRALGFDRVDVGFSHLSLDPSLSSVRQGQILKAALASEGLKPSDLFPALPFETNDPDRDHRKQNRRQFTRLLALAAEAGSPGLTLKPGIPQPASWELGWGICVEVLGDFCSLAGKNGLRLSVEPHLDSIIEEPERALRLVEAVEGLRITLDYSHFIARGCEPKTVKVLHPYTSHFHLRQARAGRLQSRAEEGAIPAKAIIAALVAAGYTGAICLEYQCSEWQGCNDVDVVTETVATLRQLGLELS